MFAKSQLGYNIVVGFFCFLNKNLKSKDTYYMVKGVVIHVFMDRYKLQNTIKPKISVATAAH